MMMPKRVVDYLKVANRLPLDGEVHSFAKVGTALDVSHVQVEAYLDVAEFALRRALDFPAEKPKASTKRFYARTEGGLWSGSGNSRWGRWSLALDGLNINDKASFTKRGFSAVPDGVNVDDFREQSSTAIFRGAYTPFYYGFRSFKAPVRGD